MPSDQTASRTLLLTGATGFVGRHLDAALAETDWTVRRATRNRDKASQAGWVHLDVEQPATIEPALEPEITRGSSPSSSNVLPTPRWKKPSTPPPLSMSAERPKQILAR